jgi:uncharacterized phage protein (TIGR01671 family)
MREIKFRAWTGMTMEYNVTVGKFGTFYVNPGAKGDGLDEKDTASLTPFTTIYSKETSVMQFTGLKDKNGKEIYEGNVLEWRARDNDGSRMKSREAVGWKYGAYITGEKNNEESFYDEGNRRQITKQSEVIGNIYENPELLN